MIVPSVISQRTYPGAGDVDDCWVVATVWAAVASRPGIWRPSVTTFRARAGDPDDGYRDGGSIDEVYKGATGCWPNLDIDKYASSYSSPLLTQIKAGRPASVAVDSAALPSKHRFGFYGKHQVGVVYTNGRYLLANPLAPNGSAPQPITEDQLRYAMFKLVYAVPYRAVLFPKPIVSGYRATVRPGLFYVYTIVDGRVRSKSLRATGGFSAACTAPRTYYWGSGSRSVLVRLTSGSRAGTYISAGYAREL